MMCGLLSELPTSIFDGFDVFFEVFSVFWFVLATCLQTQMLDFLLGFVLGLRKSSMFVYLCWLFP
jgi:hypothetical protein